MIAVAPASFDIPVPREGGVRYIQSVWVAIALSMLWAMREPDNRIKR